MENGLKANITHAANEALAKEQSLFSSIGARLDSILDQIAKNNNELENVNNDYHNQLTKVLGSIGIDTPPTPPNPMREPENIDELISQKLDFILQSIDRNRTAINVQYQLNNHLRRII